mgnify:CR=1 FL=1
MEVNTRNGLSVNIGDSKRDDGDLKLEKRLNYSTIVLHPLSVM